MKNKEKKHRDVVSELRRDQSKFTTQLGKMEELSEKIEYGLLKLEGAIRDSSAPPRYGKILNKIADKKADRHAMILAAEKGAASLELQLLSSGRAMIQIDFGEPIELAPRPAQLLDILTTELVEGEEGFLKWVAWDQIVLKLHLNPNNKKDRHNAKNLISRVRKILKQRASNPFYLQIHRYLGVRFRIRPELVTRYDITGNASNPSINQQETPLPVITA